MARMGGMYGPDATFLGVPKADLEDPASWAGTDILIIGAPFDGGTSHRPGARFGPQAIRSTDYLPHDGARPGPGVRQVGPGDAEEGDVRAVHPAKPGHRGLPRSVLRPPVCPVGWSCSQPGASRYTRAPSAA